MAEEKKKKDDKKTKAFYDFCNITSPMIGIGYRPGDFLDNLNLPNVERPGWPTCVLYDDPTNPVYRQVMQRLQGMTREQIF